MNKTITIIGVEYPIAISFKTFKILGEKWNCKGWVSVVNTFRSKLFPSGVPEEIDSTEDPDMAMQVMDFPFESAPYFQDLINAAIITANATPPDLTLEEFEETVMMDMEALSLITTEFMNKVQNTRQSQGNAEPRSKARKTATKAKPGKN